MKILFYVISLMLFPEWAASQLNTSKAYRYQKGLYNVLDVQVKQIVAFELVEKYADGSEMSDSKCDNVIYVKYNGEYFRRSFLNDIDIRWFGCNIYREDNDVIINQILSRYGAAFIPAGEFKISNSVNVPVNGTLRGEGVNSVIKVVSKSPIDAIVLAKESELSHFKVDCTMTNMDLNAGILINAWDETPFKGRCLTIKDVSIYGNYPHLQGVALKLNLNSEIPTNYRIISFCRFSDLNIYGFRDGVACEINRTNNVGISYLNANFFDNILFYNCLRPIRLINDAKVSDIKAGKSTISSNIFNNLIIQHVVGSFPAILIQGGSYNRFVAQFLDWKGEYAELSETSEFNVLESLPNLPQKVSSKNKSNKIY